MPTQRLIDTGDWRTFLVNHLTPPPTIDIHRLLDAGSWTFSGNYRTARPRIDTDTDINRWSPLSLSKAHKKLIALGCIAGIMCVAGVVIGVDRIFSSSPPCS
ncbi:uncharacterized protein LOC127876966 [Dreissena polymorpha]|uniref:uncharacterized protein LOC127876966 n=1 Tax=Dreissena polymorpha TaxID=45954 RepID=UPI0022646BC5|nr:uncharacterized protein LOC127876966 [Dreissena polymorpha]